MNAAEGYPVVQEVSIVRKIRVVIPMADGDDLAAAWPLMAIEPVWWSRS